MNFTLVGLKGHKPLVKTVNKDGTTESYPLVKNMTSKEYEVDVSSDLDEFADAIKRIGKDGSCLLKGTLEHPLKKESRAQKTNKDEAARWVCIDIDGLRMPNMDTSAPLDKAKLSLMAEAIVKELPACFQETSYIAQASSSLGTKGERVSLHLYFVLKTPIDPVTLKVYLQSLNLNYPLFSKALRLTASGHSLSYPLDPTVADNTKLIYVAPPVYKDKTADPFPNEDERLVVVNKPDHKVDLAKDPDLYEDPVKIDRNIKTKVRALRSLEGLANDKISYGQIMVDGMPKQYIKNPKLMRIDIIDDSTLPYVRCNVNGGDSGAYFVDIRSPGVMRNFKDEDYFDLKAANPHFYQNFIDKYADKAESLRKGERPIAFRDHETGGHLAAIYDSDTKTFNEEYPLRPIGKQDIEDFYAGHRGVAPETVPQGRVFFDPTTDGDKINLDKEPYFVNTYSPPKHFASPPKFPSCDIDDISHLKARCPNTFRLIDHVCGNDVEGMARFLNWLAYIYQTRTKTGTAWVFSGTQGTGKGLLMNYILRDVFGKEYAPVETLQSLDEKYNSSIERAIICNVDEFRMKDSKGKNVLSNTLKNAITEPTVRIRRMHSDSIERPSYVNFIFFSNSRDAISIEYGDRRYNVAKPQHTPIRDPWPDIIAGPEHWFKDEVPHFCGFLKNFDVDADKARTPLVNEYKQDMMSAGMDFFDEFAEAVRDGNLQFFQPIMDMSLNDSLTASRTIEAQNILRRWAKSLIQGDRILLKPEEARTLHNTMCDSNKLMQVNAFGSCMKAQGFKKRRLGRPDGSNPPSFEVGDTTDHGDMAVAKEIVDNNVTFIKNEAS